MNKPQWARLSAPMTSSVLPLAGDVGAESHWQQGGWDFQQHTAARVYPVRRLFITQNISIAEFTSLTTPRKIQAHATSHVQEF